ncbi:MAG TPA: hypothetical protein VII33_01855 [Nakamurella sp.]
MTSFLGVPIRVRGQLVRRAVDVDKMVSIPAMEELDGFCSASLLVDRASGRAVSTATYGSREALQRNRAQAVAVRAAPKPAPRCCRCASFELALAHLRCVARPGARGQ